MCSTSSMKSLNGFDAQPGIPDFFSSTVVSPSRRLIASCFSLKLYLAQASRSSNRAVTLYKNK